jgi:hypothetical protein
MNKYKSRAANASKLSCCIGRVTATSCGDESTNILSRLRRTRKQMIFALLLVVAAFACTNIAHAAPEELNETPVATPSLPAGVVQLVAKGAAAFQHNDMAELAPLFHPNFLLFGRNKDAQMKYYASQVMGQIKQWEWKFSEFKMDGNIAHVKAVVVTEAGNFPTDTYLIEEDGKWYFYGNQKK